MTASSIDTSARVPRVRGALARVATLGAATMFAAMGGFVVFAATISQFAAPMTAPTKSSAHAIGSADGIVVLTGGEHRIAEAVDLFVSGQARRLKISGVNPTTPLDDARRRTRGLTPLLRDCCVDIDHATDTRANAEATRAWARTWGFNRLVVVTSNYHMPRSLAELARLLPDVELISHPVASKNFHAAGWWRHPGSVRIAISEYLKFLPSLARLAAARMTTAIGQSSPSQPPPAQS